MNRASDSVENGTGLAVAGHDRRAKANLFADGKVTRGKVAWARWGEHAGRPVDDEPLRGQLIYRLPDVIHTPDVPVEELVLKKRELAPVPARKWDACTGVRKPDCRDRGGRVNSVFDPGLVDSHISEKAC